MWKSKIVRKHREQEIMMEATTGYQHIALNASGVPVIEGTTMKVVELVLDHKAYGWGAEELHLQHP
jgi:hypothetical protein